ncbi:MAG TPA: hypothetical protein VK303_06150, partial [Desulfobacteria bacterium]|nr:hypothetical protein [Desulfobacteria bacterium]
MQHPVPEVPPALRKPLEPLERESPKEVHGFRWIEEEVSPDAGQCGDLVRRVSEHAGVQARRLAVVERRAKAGLDPAGDRRLRHQ